MPTLAELRAERAGATDRGARLGVLLRAGDLASEIALEPGHLERFFRMAVYRAIRDGHVPPGRSVTARLVPGRVRAWHGPVACLESCAVELVDAAGDSMARVEFPRTAFAVFAMARGVHLMAAAGSPADALEVAYSLHAVAEDGAALEVEIPALPVVSLDAIAAGAAAHERPGDAWIATFLGRAVMDGIDELERQSRAGGVEVAGRIHTRAGFDPACRRFVRVLEDLVISRDTQATESTVVSTGASWSEFLAGGQSGPQAPSTVHSHLHLDGEPSERSSQPAGHRLRASDRPIISIDDIVTHYTAFPDPLSAALIVSVFPGRRVLSVYGYGPEAELQELPGYWLMEAAGRRPSEPRFPRRTGADRRMEAAGRRPSEPRFPRRTGADRRMEAAGRRPSEPRFPRRTGADRRRKP